MAYTGARGGGGGGAREGRQQGAAQPRDRREPQRRQRPAARRRDGDMPVGQPRHDDGGGGNGQQGPGGDRIPESHFLIVAIDSKYFDTRVRYASGTRSLPPARSLSFASAFDSRPATDASVRSSALATSPARDCHAG